MAKWMAEAFAKNKGALKATAKKRGGLTKKGTIKKTTLDVLAKQPGKTGRRARLVENADYRK